MEKSHSQQPSMAFVGASWAALLLGTVAYMAGLWNAKTVLAGSRSWWAKLWSIVLAIAFLALLWLGLRYHLPGLHAFY